MTRDEYAKYLRSAHWQDVKRRFKASRLYQNGCYACGSQEDLQLHHKTYQRVGSERLRDLVQLCGQCHTKVHQVLQTRGGVKTNRYNVAKKLRKFIKKWGKDRALQEW